MTDGSSNGTAGESVSAVLPLRRRVPPAARRRHDRRRPLPWRRGQAALPQSLTASDSSLIFPLSTTGGSHYVTLEIGTPPQAQAVIVDTGSAWVAFGCAPGCDMYCGEHVHPFFAYNESSSARILKCGECSTQCLDDLCLVTQHYSEGSAWRAFSVEDSVGFQTEPGTRQAPTNVPPTTVPFVFGCQTKLTGLFVPQLENGIMGLSRGPENLVSHMRAAGRIPRAAFSLCFHEHPNDGGWMTVGTLDDATSSSRASRDLGEGAAQDGGDQGGAMAYASLTPSPTGWFLVELSALFLGGHILTESDAPVSPADSPSTPPSRRRHALLDSGTTDTYMLRSLRPSFSSQFSRATRGRLPFVPGAPYRLSMYEVLLLPALEVDLGEEQAGAERTGARLSIPPMSYMEEQREGENGNGEERESETEGQGQVARTVWVPRLYFTEASLAILGSNALRGQEVLFDMEGGRVGVRSLPSCSHRRRAAALACEEQCGRLSASASSPPASPVCRLDGVTDTSVCHATCGLASEWEEATGGRSSGVRPGERFGAPSEGVSDEGTSVDPWGSDRASVVREGKAGRRASLLLWEGGPCPPLQPPQRTPRAEAEDRDRLATAQWRQCRSLLFSGAPGCADLALALLPPPKFHGPSTHESAENFSSGDLPSPSLLCNNPCMEAVRWACRDAEGTYIPLLRGLPHDFCARNQEGKYCLEAYMPLLSGCPYSVNCTASLPSLCGALQDTGCCFQHLLSRHPQAADLSFHCPRSQDTPPACPPPPDTLFGPGSLPISAEPVTSLSSWGRSLTASEIVLLGSLSLLSLLLVAVVPRWARALASRGSLGAWYQHLLRAISRRPSVSSVGGDGVAGETDSLTREIERGTPRAQCV